MMLTPRHKAAIAADAPDDPSKTEKRRIHSGEDPPQLQPLRRRIKGLAKWHGVPYREERLYPTVCPVCGAKTEELPGRRV